MYPDNLDISTLTHLNFKTKEVSAVTDTTISVKIEGKTYNKTITLKPITVEIGPSPQKELKIGDTHQLQYAITGPEGLAEFVSWQTTNEDIVSVSSNGLITAKSPGTAKIKAVAKNTKTNKNYYSEDIIVSTYQPAESISIINKPGYACVGDKYKFICKTYPENAKAQAVKWDVAPQDMANVNSYTGEITFLKAGTVKVTAKNLAYPSLVDDFTVTVLNFSETMQETPMLIEHQNALFEAEIDYNVWPAASYSTFYQDTDSIREAGLGTIRLKARTMTTPGLVGVYPNATNLLKHYLSNEGTPYIFDFKNMNNNWAVAKNARKQDINEILSVSEIITENKNSANFISATRNEHNFSDSSDWGYSIGKYSTYVKCSVERNGNYYEANIKYYMYDIYDWNKNIIDMGNLPVSQAEMWELHHAGWAKVFEVQGLNTLKICWEKGERWDTGASIDDIS